MRREINYLHRLCVARVKSSHAKNSNKRINQTVRSVLSGSVRMICLHVAKIVCCLIRYGTTWYDMLHMICYIWYIRYDTYDTWVLIFWNASQLFGFRTRLSVNREKLPRTNSTLFVRKTIQNWYRLNYPTHGVAAVSLITKRLGLSHSVWCHSLVHNVCRTVQICWHYYSVSACITYATWCACLIQCWECTASMASTVSVLLLSKASARGVLQPCQNKRDNKYCNSNFFECVWETKGWCIPTVQFCLHSLSRGLLCKQFVLFGPCVSVFNTMNVYYSENVKIQILSHFWLGRRWWRRGGCRRRIFWGLRSSPRPCQWKNSNQGLQVSDAAEITRAM